MIVANLAGISVFATGGIGGVHRGAERTFDISADLQELANTNVAVVCAGAKSILDIGLTLEYLETSGVPVVGYKTEELPAFYTRTSGFNVDHRVDTTSEIAEMINIKWDLGLRGGVVVANPIPEKFSMDPKFISKIIEEALKEAEAKGIKGKEDGVTTLKLQVFGDLVGTDEGEFDTDFPVGIVRSDRGSRHVVDEVSPFIFFKPVHCGNEGQLLGRFH